MTGTRTAFPAVLALVLAACTGTTEASPRATPDPTPGVSPTATASPEASPSTEASQSPAESAEPSSSQVGGEFGGFTFQSHAEADALFLDRFSCQNLDDGYEVDYPAEWNANAEVGGAAQCSWFAPTEYEAGDGSTLPEEIAIEMIVVDGARDYDDVETSDRAEGYVGVTQPAFRVRITDGNEEAYEYVVQLGESYETGRNLVARTSTEMGGDFDLNRAVLDRMMATMEFIGVIQ